MLDIIKYIYEKIPYNLSKKMIEIFRLNPYYSDRIWNDIKKIELDYKNCKNLNNSLNNLGIKDIDNLKKIELIDSEYLRRNLDTLINLKVRGYYTSTGGTTGIPLKLYLSDQSYYKDIAHVIWGWNKLGYQKGDKKLTLRGAASSLKDKLYKYNPIYNELQINVFKMDKYNIDEIIREIEKFNPRFGHGYPSSFFRLATLLENKKINIKLKGISLTSENLYEEQRKVIEKVFDCKARGFWGHTERLGIAIEKVNERNIYEIPLTYGLIEIIKENGIEAEEGEEGEIVCTGFINKGMKLIRYKTGDYATVHKKEKGIVIEIRNLIGKRGKEYLYTKNGQKISTASLTLHSKAQYEFKYIQLLQNEVEKVNVNVVLWDNKDVSKDIRALKEEFESKVQDIDFKINIVNEKEIKITHRGKIPYLITEINKIER
ncbi:hypothetical protein DW663_10885 [Fusobacterium mortiferum]|jgi:phenylacetate-CoA ligase|uniref:Phenylacetate--CoA ligase family protein n=1 Tax=Fusobacterium mortiferum TaxID=850 RepID=A0A414PP76_FUSMR|nr:hypothetical protein [Fusobacterium mortiferum]RHF70332.1 hypothetical protein DW663_10885 [Fusobacterium mortiferum]